MKLQRTAALVASIAMVTSGCASMGGGYIHQGRFECAVAGMFSGAGIGVATQAGASRPQKRFWGGLIGGVSGLVIGAWVCGAKDRASPSAQVSASPSSGEAPLSVTFEGSGNAPDGEIKSFEWDLGDGTKASGPKVEHTYDKPGDYKVTLTVTDNHGLSGTANTRVSARAQAAPPPPPPVVKKRIVLRGVNFAFDSSNIRLEDRDILDAAVEVLKENTDVRIQVAGHTDATGPEAYNQGLSERRAKGVRDYLLKGGVSVERLDAIGNGETNPVADNGSRDGRAQNRRVELNIRE